MASIIMVYASMTGNTEEMAELIVKGIREAGIEPVVKEVTEADPAELNGYDGIVLGAYTDGDGELPYHFEDFYRGLAKLDLTGRKAAVFGSGDTFYDHFCASVDIIREELVKRGAEVIDEGLKVELNPNKEEQQKCAALGAKLVAALTAVKS